jgi:hypothetical protein
MKHFKRVPYGVTKPEIDHLSNEDLEALWCWEIFNIDYFTPIPKAYIQSIRQKRSLYG